jgi:hypothetical protein
MLLNLSNHPSAPWPANQKEAAEKEFETVQDLPFPQIPPNLSSAGLDQLVESYVQNIRNIDPIAVHIMGELTFTYRLVYKLKAIGIRCLASTTERIVSEDGKGNKTSTFQFVQFRDY